MTVTNQLRDEILEGVFPPGERLVELNLSKRYGVGRASIRAALVELDSEGLVDREANRGATVRRISLEEAIHQITEIPARLYGIRRRGRIAEGWHADLVVFDADRIGPGPIHTRHDLPAGAGRLYAEAEGIDSVWVGGSEIVRGKECTRARPGTILRSGRDTETVEVPGGSEAP